MGRRKHVGVVYVVEWPAIGVVKVGVTEHSRWRSWRQFGGYLLHIEPFDSVLDAYDVEGEIHRFLWSNADPGFTSAMEAAPYLGDRGGGWKECYRMQPRILACTLARIRASNADRSQCA